jgi:hypothetical protein
MTFYPPLPAVRDDEWMLPLPPPELDPLLAQFLPPSGGADLDEGPPEAPAFTRRQALRLFAAGAAVSACCLLGRRKAQAFAPLAILAPLFKAGVTLLATKAFEAATSRLFAPRVQRSAVVPRRLGRRFHDQFSLPVRLVERFPVQRTRFNYHLHLNDVPLASPNPRDAVWQDYNLAEMRRVSGDGSIRRFGGVLYPHDYRQAPTRFDQERFQDLCRRVERIDARLYRLEYTRTFRDQRNRSRLAFGVTSRADPNEMQLFVSP